VAQEPLFWHKKTDEKSGAFADISLACCKSFDRGSIGRRWHENGTKPLKSVPLCATGATRIKAKGKRQIKAKGKRQKTKSKGMRTDAGARPSYWRFTFYLLPFTFYFLPFAPRGHPR
jgi:hypothetical protein